MLDMATSLTDRLEAARLHALNGGVPIRRKDGKLYALLAECLAICESVQASAQEPELRELVRVSVDLRNQGNAGTGRRYAERKSDAFVLVARYVLADVDGRNSFYRYAVTLREAHSRQIAAVDLEEWLRANGGANALYAPAAYRKESGATKVLHLNQSVTFPRSGEFTITLRHDGKGFFDVVAA